MVKISTHTENTLHIVDHRPCTLTAQTLNTLCRVNGQLVAMHKMHYGEWRSYNKMLLNRLTQRIGLWIRCKIKMQRNARA